jgi:hypothetical protein
MLVILRVIGGAFNLQFIVNKHLTILQVNKNIKCVISEHVVSIKSTDNQFKDLFDVMTSGQYNDREVQVFVRREKSENW